jgi:hypothetical protein
MDKNSLLVSSLFYFSFTWLLNTLVLHSCIYLSRGNKLVFLHKLIWHQPKKWNLKYSQKSGLEVTVLLKSRGKRVNKDSFLRDSSTCVHHKNSVYEFGYRKLRELYSNYILGHNFRISFVIGMWWWLIQIYRLLRGTFTHWRGQKI